MNLAPKGYLQQFNVFWANMSSTTSSLHLHFLKKKRAILCQKLSSLFFFFLFSFLVSDGVKPFKYHCGHHINFILILFLFVSNIPLLFKKISKIQA